MKFRFLDGVVSSALDGPGQIMTEFTFPQSEDYLNTHFHKPSQIPFTIVLEAMAASAGRLIEVVTENKARALMMKVEEANFLNPVSGGDKLVVESKLLGIQDRTGEKVGMARTRVKGWVSEKAVAEACIVYLCFPVRLAHRGSEQLR